MELDLEGVVIDIREDIQCEFCKDKAFAVGRYTMSEGCVCSTKKEQDLCGQHVLRASPLGTMELTHIYRLEFYEQVIWKQKMPVGG